MLVRSGSGPRSPTGWVRAVGGVWCMAEWLFIVYFLYMYFYVFLLVSNPHFLRGPSVSSTMLPVNVLTKLGILEHRIGRPVGEVLEKRLHNLNRKREE